MKGTVLIGMPSSGKSTVGRLLSARLDVPFLDGDDLIRARTGMSLSELIAERGAAGFLRLEEELLCAVSLEDTVFAPGGSAVYSERAMSRFRDEALIVYLRLREEEIERRIPDFTARGVVMRGQIRTLKELYSERVPLYERYAHITVDCNGKTPDETAEEILSAEKL